MREEETKRSSQDSKMKRFFKKRWVFPAIYIASAAIILTGVLWYQSSLTDNAQDKFDYEDTDVTGKKQTDEPAVTVNRSLENFKMPVKNPDDAVVQKQFYDNDSSAEDQEAALVFYNNSYHPNTGMDIAMKDGKTFDVLAALSGTVTRVEEDALLGNVIEIEHDKGIVTQYQSVTDFKVKVGDEVKQGQALASAGKSLFNEDAGIHVHFEIRKDDVPVNPLKFFDKPLSALQELDPTDNADKASTEEDEAAEDEATEEENAEDGEESGSDKKESGETEDGDQPTDNGEEDTNSSNS